LIVLKRSTTLMLEVFHLKFSSSKQRGLKIGQF
jgi:hypothetical protein